MRDWPHRGALAGEAPEFDGLRPEGTVLSDLSANVFAALLLILVVLLQLRVASDRPAPSRPLDAVADLGALARRPLGPGDLLNLLRLRAGTAAGLGIDLAAETVTLVEGGRETVLAGGAALDRLATLPRGTPVRLYVFSHRLYRPLAERLARQGLPVSELSVPRALRDPADPGRWSPAFLALGALAGAPDRFRDGLTRLLVASDEARAPDGHVAGGRDPAAGTEGVAGGVETLVSRLLFWLGAALGVAALLAGAAVLLATEGLVGREPSS